MRLFAGGGAPGGDGGAGGGAPVKKIFVATVALVAARRVATVVLLAARRVARAALVAARRVARAALVAARRVATVALVAARRVATVVLLAARRVSARRRCLAALRVATVATPRLARWVPRPVPGRMLGPALVRLARRGTRDIRRQHYNREQPHRRSCCEPPQRFARRLGEFGGRGLAHYLHSRPTACCYDTRPASGAVWLHPTDGHLCAHGPDAHPRPHQFGRSVRDKAVASDRGENAWSTALHSRRRQPWRAIDKAIAIKQILSA